MGHGCASASRSPLLYARESWAAQLAVDQAQVFAIAWWPPLGRIALGRYRLPVLVASVRVR